MDEHSLAGDHEATVDLERLNQQLQAQRAAAGFQGMALSIPTADEITSVDVPPAQPAPNRAPPQLNSAVSSTLGFTPGYGLLQEQQGVQGQPQQQVLMQSQNNNQQLKQRLRALEIQQSNLRLKNQIRALEMRQAQHQQAVNIQQSNMNLRSKIQALEMKQAQMNSPPEQYGNAVSSFTQAYQANSPQVKVDAAPTQADAPTQVDAKFAKLERMQTLLDTMKAEAKRDKKKAEAAKKVIAKKLKVIAKAKKAAKKAAKKKKALEKLKKKKAKAKKKAKKAKAKKAKAVKALKKKAAAKKKAKKAAVRKLAKAKKEAAKAKNRKAKAKVAKMKIQLQHLRLARKIAEQKAALERLKNTQHAAAKKVKSRAIAKAVARVVAKAQQKVAAKAHTQKGVKQEVRRLRALKKALQVKRSMLKRKLLRKKKRKLRKLKGKLRRLAALKKQKSELKTKEKERRQKSKVAAAERKRKHQKRKADKKATKTAAKIAAKRAAVHAHVKHAAELLKHVAALTKLNKKQFPKHKAVLAKQQRVLHKIASAAHAAVKHLHKKAAAGAKRVAAANMHHLNDHKRVDRTHRLVVHKATQQLEEVAKAARAMATAGESVGGAAARKKSNALARKIQRIADLLDSVNPTATTATTATAAALPAKKQAVMTESNADMSAAGNLPQGWLTHLAAQALHRAQKRVASGKASPASKTTRHDSQKAAHATKASRKTARKRSQEHAESPVLKRRLRALNRAKTAMEASVNEMRRLSSSAPRKSRFPREAKAAMELLSLDAHTSDTRVVTTTHSDLSTIVCFQHVHVPLSQRKAAAVEFARRFRSLAEAVTVRGGSVTLHAGYDHRYQLPHNNAKLRGVVKGMKKQRLLRSSAIANLLLLSKASAAGDVRAGHALRHASHVMQSLSWTTAELTAGAKTLAGGKVFRLVEALQQSTAVKLTLNDVFADKLARQLRSVEMTYDLTYGTKVKGQLSRGMNSYKASLVKHAREELHRDPMRLARTLRLLAVLTRDGSLRRQLRPLFKSDAGALSEVHDTAGRLANLFQSLRHPQAGILKAMENQILLMQKHLRMHMPNTQGFHLAHALQPVSALYNAYMTKGKFDTRKAARVLNRLRTSLKPIVDSDAQKVLSQLPSGAHGALRQVSARHAKAPARHVTHTEHAVAPQHRAAKATGRPSKHVDVQWHKATQHDATTVAWLKRLKAATKAVEAVGSHHGHGATRKQPVVGSHHGHGATKTHSALENPSHAQIAATRAWLKTLARQQAQHTPAPRRHQDRAQREGTKKAAPAAAPYEPDMSKVRGFVTGGKWAEADTESSPAVVESEFPEAEWSDVMSVLTP